MTSRILVVDDDVQLLDVVANYLKRDGCDVEVATDGPTGLRIALETLPDLVVLDVMLPGLDGYKVCQQIRQVAPIPVMMLTARTEEDDRLLGFERGADDYLTKPFSPRRAHRAGQGDPPPCARRGRRSRFGGRLRRRRRAGPGEPRGHPRR